MCFQILVNLQHAVSGRVNRLRCGDTLPASLDHERNVADILRNVSVLESDINDRLVVISNWENNILSRENNITLKEMLEKMKSVISYYARFSGIVKVTWCLSHVCTFVYALIVLSILTCALYAGRLFRTQV